MVVADKVLAQNASAKTENSLTKLMRDIALFSRLRKIIQNFWGREVGGGLYRFPKKIKFFSSARETGHVCAALNPPVWSKHPPGILALPPALAESRRR